VEPHVVPRSASHISFHATSSAARLCIRFAEGTPVDTRIVVTALVIVAILIVIAAAFVMRRRKSDQLKRRFGPEYDRTVIQQQGDARRAEATLLGREKRVEAFPIRA